MAEPVDSTGPLLFSIVAAAYNVAPYLDDFIASVEGQSFPRDRFEVIVVDGGSSDDTLHKLQGWQERSPHLVTVVTEAPADRAAARNAGLELARGSWVTFADPDDAIAPDYLAEVAAFIEERGTVALIATNRLILDGAKREPSDSHPLRRHFRPGNRVRDVRRYPNLFHASASAGFFRREVLERTGLRFDSRLSPNFEDGRLACQYLLSVGEPTIGFVATARYHDRTRLFSSAFRQGTLEHIEAYVRVLRHGFLDVLREGAETSGTGVAPEWLQNLVLYELSWYFTSRDADAGAVTEALGPLADEVHELVARVLAYLSRHVIAGFAVRPVKPAWREILLHAYEPTPWHQESVLLSRLDRHQGLVRATYRFTGDPPTEHLLSGGIPVEPTHAKVRDIAYHGRVLVRERVVWMSSRGSVRVRLNGQDMNLEFEERVPIYTRQPSGIKRHLDPTLVAGQLREAARKSLSERLILRLARTRLVRHFFGNAWVLMDRITDAGDNAERLFRYLRRSRRRINAWFVVEGGSPDWRRIRGDGYHRVVPHGSLRWKLLMANCRHLISSHVSGPVIRPPELTTLMEPTWRFTFLQHGVIHTNLSGWLNRKPIDLFITSSAQEYPSLAGDHTPYAFTTKEVKLTGLPRWDRLRQLALRTSIQQRDLVLVAPTWRSGLVPLLLPRSKRRAIEPAFFVSDYARNWMSLLRSEELAEACHDLGLTVGFLPHPNVQPALPGMRLPPHVRALTFADNDVQELFARSAVLVTDYSSVAFDAAYIDRPVVYFQFDREVFLGGEHHGRRGYFEYERDGFGPVTETVKDATQAILETIRSGGSPAPRYQARIDATFPLRDGKCCERVVDEIKRSTRRLSPADAAVPTIAPLLPERVGPRP